ncbi:MAG: hypothetical protein Q7T86_02970 [Hyphomicrobiaceae bacterium]|nr:hypothetical protein [Hyphomicrobiaceae bacterium]
MFKTSIIATLAGVMALTLAVDDAEARRGGKRSWELLGSQKVGFLIDKDVIQVGRKDGDFSKIKIVVKGNDVEFKDVDIVYGNGQKDDIQIRNRIKAGGETRAVDLKGGDRFIKRVEFVYKSKPSFKGQATVELWGKD